MLSGVVVLDGDVLWCDDWWESPAIVDWLYARWLLIASQVGRSGCPLVLCTAVHPPRWEQRPERALLTDIHYLALVAEPDVYEARLLARDPEAVRDPHYAEFLSFNRWLRENGPLASPPMTVLDTTSLSASEATAAVADWIRERL